jgi:hypothetical protein
LQKSIFFVGKFRLLYRGEISALREKKTYMYYFEGGMGPNFTKYFGEKKNTVNSFQSGSLQ